MRQKGMVSLQTAPSESGILLENIRGLSDGGAFFTLMSMIIVLCIRANGSHLKLSQLIVKEKGISPVLSTIVIFPISNQLVFSTKDQCTLFFAPSKISLKESS